MMQRRNRTMIILFSLLLALGGVTACSSSQPLQQKEEWVSYGNESLIRSIDKQLEGMDIERIEREKSPYIIEKGIETIQQAVQNGIVSYEEITAIYLNRIKTLDQSAHGYNSISEINPNAIIEARERDRLKNENKGINNPLFGMPVTLKENINTSDMPTSAGTVAFAEFIPKEDADMVKRLKESGVVIIGKNNLSELANYLSSEMPDSYSGKKGMIVNPYGPQVLSPSGSSGGSAVSVAANLVPLSIGTETIGSIISPAAANSVVGFKPSRGNIPGEGIFPLAKALDTAGPMARSVKDAALGYQAMTNVPLSSMTFDADALKGKMLGLVNNSENNKEVLATLKKALAEMGVNLIEIELKDEGVYAGDILSQSFKHDFEEFTARYDFPIKKLKDFIAFNKEDPKRRIKYGQDMLEADVKVEQMDKELVKNAVNKACLTLKTAFNSNSLDAVVFLNETGVDIPAIAGYPELAIPFGADAQKAPVGVTFVTRKGEDEALLNFGYSFEQKTRGRLML